MAQAKSALTHSAEEIDVNSLLFATQIYVIPYFQRPYTWASKELGDFLKDLQRARDEKSSQFLGAMIVFERQSPVGDPKILEVVDGQQRLTTLTLFICAIISAFVREKRFSDAARLFRSFIWHNQPVSFGSNLRLHPSRFDRKHFNLIIKDLVNDDRLNHELQNPKITYLAATAEGDSQMDAQYKRIKRYVDGQVKDLGSGVLDELTDSLSNFFTVVTIRLKDPTSCSRIFERLNFRGVPVTTGDLVRNEIFSKIANRSAQEIEELNTHVWEPFYNKFQPKSQFNEYFFPYGLVVKSSVAKADVFGELRNQWANIADPAEIVKRLSLYQDAFLDFCNRTNELSLSKALKSVLLRLRHSEPPSSIYPFVMRVSRSVKDGELGELSAIEALEVVEGFLVRRAVCGIEPTGLHAVFKTLWSSATELGKKAGLPEDSLICRITVTGALRSHKTQFWPDDAEFLAALKERHVASSAICKYLLREFEVNHGGDVPSDIPWIEHILPQKIDGTPWAKQFTEKEHQKWLHTLANIIPLSSQQNQSLGNKEFSEKRTKFLEDSMFKSARAVGQKYKDWNSSSLNSRAKSIADWGVSRWPMPTKTEN